MFERFTDDARIVVTDALEEARGMRHGHVGTEHLLVALADEPEIVALGLNRERARAEVVKTVGLGETEADGQLPLTPAAKQALEDALGEAMRLGHRQIQRGHLLLAVLRQRDGVARRILLYAKVSPNEFREAITQRLLGRQAEAPGQALVARLGNLAVGDVGNPRTDTRLLLAILDRNGPMAAWLRERGIDEPTLRRMLDAG
jgi:ATP-dependent Clp protease ATP-binding subunit ClpA